ncbi:MAG: Plug domain-containing protein, partial [Bacteroidota bacterium]|nr:Plug domain-containing protein [Bacteroidota bacterium]
MKKLKNSILSHSGITLSFLLLFPVLQLHTSNKKNLHFEIIKRKIDPIIIEKNDSINFKPPVDLNEVVVTGQGNSITRRRLSSRVTSINADDLAGLSNNRLDEMLQTSIPNVQINMTNGQPGSTSQIKSRGLSSAFSNSTPIVYVDGVRVDNMNTGATLGFSR